MSKPQLVLIPGAWHTPEAFSIIIPKLESHGYTVHTRQLPAVDPSPVDPPTDLTKDVAAVRELVNKAIGDGNDVVVVAHSWAGLVAGCALTGVGKREREAKGEKGGVVRTAYISSFLAPIGVGLMDALQGNIPDWWYVDVSAPSSLDTNVRIQLLKSPTGHPRHHPPRSSKHLLQRPPRSPTAGMVVQDQAPCLCHPASQSDGRIVDGDSE
jgi:pimeloyl-ACP methyl ester carboxylesterase